MNENEILEKINPAKDVDGFHAINVGKLSQGQPALVPCTPAGVIEILKFYEIPIARKTRRRHRQKQHRRQTDGAACFCRKTRPSRSVIRGRKTLRKSASQADILIAAVGRAGFVRGDFIKDGRDGH